MKTQFELFGKYQMTCVTIKQYSHVLPFYKVKITFANLVKKA